MAGEHYRELRVHASVEPSVKSNKKVRRLKTDGG